MTPKAGSTITHGRHRAGASSCPKRNAKRRPTFANKFFQSTVKLVMSVCLCAEEAEKKEAQGGTTSDQQEPQLDGCDACGTAPNLSNHAWWQHTPSKKIRIKIKIEINGGRVWLCVWRCGCLPALAAKKQNKRERNVCSAPQALVARPHVTAPSARRSSRPLLMRAAGEAHRAVVMSVSVGVRVEQLGGKHTAPLTGRALHETIKKREE
ncbi:hypothetical protein ECC02_013142 [Trypanosoma cruzi]|uniref:Uncharacterized protein n=1 Tax=Trypanosoma cruzi TaxID=5693 RepID=A0A7J6XID0_TRYCR|nr:hypothetical protein ECC02_013142 [Trypanosoma cruzi]